MQKIITLLWVLFLGNGVQMKAQVCPGTPGQVTWECWRGINDGQIEELETTHRYPNHPDLTKKLYTLEMPLNFDEYFGSRMRGFIHVDTTTTVTFNITVDYKCNLFLSTDATVENLQLIAYSTINTAQEGHDTYPEQTSVPIVLTAGVDYYFEMVHAERTSADFGLIWWKTDLVDPNEWNVITSAFIKDIACDTNNNCPVPGTSCNDGDPATINDEEDGYCHCFGVPVTNNTCVGEQNELVKYRYDNIVGGSLNELYAAPTFPAMPNYSEVLDELGQAQNSIYSDYGTLIQGYISVPVSGMYKFNLTSDHESIFYLSSDDDPANMTTNEISVPWVTGFIEHDKYPEQTSSFISLNAGQYYYFELNHKEASSSDHFTVFWQTPFSEAGKWKRISSRYLYDYDCELACIPQGTLCDDGDPLTNNDMYDSNCECIGTPCSGSNCDSIASYMAYDKCAITDQIDNNVEASWLSCVISTNPNPLRAASHWIEYDMSVRHFLFQSQVWNYNVSDSVDRGFEMVVIDYSLDGTTWTELGTYTWSLAPGDSLYSGFVGPDFLGAEARYVLITCLDTSPVCKGLGKVAFTAVKCPYLGTACDDGDHTTLYDQYNDNCECIGTSYEENECVDQALVLGDSVLITNKYSAVQTIQSISEIDGMSKVSFVGGDFVVLDTGFETQADATFIATIDTCSAAGGLLPQTLQSIIQEEKIKREEDKKKLFQVIQSKNNDEILVKFYLDKPMNAKIQLLDVNQQVVFTLIDHNYIHEGIYTKKFRTKKLSSGMYVIQLTAESGTMQKKFMVKSEI